MDTKKISFSRLAELISNLRQFGDIDTPQTPMEYAAHKLNKQWDGIYKKYQKESQEGAQDIEQDHLALDERGLPILDEKGNFRLTVEGVKARTKFLRALNEREVEVILYFCKHPALVDALPLHLKEMYKGILFEWDEKAFEASFEVPKEKSTEEYFVPVVLNGKEST